MSCRPLWPRLLRLRPPEPDCAARSAFARRMFASVVERYRGLSAICQRSVSSVKAPSQRRDEHAVDFAVELSGAGHWLPANIAQNSHLKELSLHRARRHSERVLDGRTAHLLGVARFESLPQLPICIRPVCGLVYGWSWLHGSVSSSTRCPRVRRGDQQQAPQHAAWRHP
jgi:hypothetical protein